MKFSKILFYLPICLLSSIFCHSQINNEIFLNEYNIDPSDSQKLFFRIENTNFFKNNEYFSPFYEGFTLPGSFIKPKFSYLPTAKTKFEIGACFLKYSGLENYSKVLPLLTFQYNYKSWLNVVMGSIYGSYDHRLVEPLYQSDRHYLEPDESGLQLLFDFPHFKSDVWVTWENFIFPDDISQEQIFGGVSGKIIFVPDKVDGVKNTRKFFCEIPMQATVNHWGGQINKPLKDMSTLINTASGIKFGYKINRFLESVSYDAYFTTFNDNSPKKNLPYISGYGILSDLSFQTRFAGFYLGYWYGENFISAKGEPLFQSFSKIDSAYFVDVRQLITLKFDLKRNIGKEVKLGLRFEGYYDLLKSNFDYSYGLNIIFNRSFFIKKL